MLGPLISNRDQSSTLYLLHLWFPWSAFFCSHFFFFFYPSSFIVFWLFFCFGFFLYDNLNICVAYTTGWASVCFLYITSPFVFFFSINVDITTYLWHFSCVPFSWKKRTNTNQINHNGRRWSSSSGSRQWIRYVQGWFRWRWCSKGCVPIHRRKTASPGRVT